MQERALADERMRIGHAAAEQQRRRADRARSGDECARTDRHAAAVGVRTAACSMAEHSSAVGATLEQTQAVRARSREQGRAAFERAGIVVTSIDCFAFVGQPTPQ